MEGRRTDDEHELEWIELTADYRCNNKCLGCYSISDHGPSMDRKEIVAALRLGRERGARNLWLGGGEPTLRPDLFAIVSKARRMGYERVRLQSNGMLLSYPEFARRCAEAGVTQVCFGIRGSGPATHDRLTATPGCHALMLKGLEEARSAGLSVEADLLIYRENMKELVEMVRVHAPAGVERFHIWLFSAVDDAEEKLHGQVPRITEVMPEI
ncbi:MAG: radical SAM protein, partial [Myxococcota bacterium]